MCVEFSDRLKELMKKENLLGEHLIVKNVFAHYVISKKNGIIGDRGFHQAIQVDDVVFDNLNSKGENFKDWINDLDLPTNHKMGAQYLDKLEW